MQNWNYDMLKTNINELMKKNNTTQKQLAEAIGMTQPNLSRAISDSYTTRLTVEQLVSISLYFKVSVDRLLGLSFDDDTKTSTKEICLFITNILKKDFKAKLTTFNKREICCTDWDGDGRMNFTERTNTYNAIYFPNYYDLNEEEKYCKDKNEEESLYHEYHDCGNDLPRNISINKFIENMASIIELYKKHEITDEVFDVVLKGFLDKTYD